ncbi:MAG: hypothetical protein DRJ33_08175, partial [Candidatus Methanomethylicota archaeon]
RVVEAIDKAYVTPDMSDIDVELLSHPVAIALVLATGSRPLLRRYAVAEAKRCYELLQLEEDDKLVEVAKDAFNWRVNKVKLKVGERFFDFSLAIDDYLKASKSFRSPHWKLVNRLVANGLAYLKKNELARLIAEEFKNRVSEKNPISEGLPEKLMNIALEVFSYYKSRVKVPEEVEDVSALEATISEYPPCVKRMIEDIKSGKSLSHTARFTVTTFLLNVGKSVEEVIDLFRNVADFDEGKTRYQVEHIAGERGSKVKYTPPSCDTLKSFGLCFPDPLCKGIKHPLAYYRKAAKLRKRGITVASETL